MPAPNDAPFGGSLDDQANWAHQNINSEFSKEAWKAMGPMDSGCPPQYPYRSQRSGGDNACVEHPDNCPHGKTLHGSTCIPWEQANQMFGGGYGDSAAAPQGAGMAAPGSNPWQVMAPPQPAGPQVELNPAGGTPWGGTPQGLPQALTPFQAPQANSATGNLLASTMAGKQAAPGVQQSLGTGWTSGQDGLTQMMARQQRKQGQIKPGLGTIKPGLGGQWWA